MGQIWSAHVLKIKFYWKTAMFFPKQQSMTAFPLQRLNWRVVIKIILPAKLKIFTIWPFIAKVCKLDLIKKKTKPQVTCPRAQS